MSRERFVDLTPSGAACPAPMTRAALISLRNAGSLRPECHYVVTDHVQGRLVAGTTITLHADSSIELSESVSVNTTYDNDGWFGIYDIDRALVLELRDNRNNIARGINGVEVSQFDWGNTSYTNVTVDNATLTADIGNAALKQNVVVEKQASLNITGFTGVLSNNVFSNAISANFSGANGTWRLSRFSDGGVFNASGYTGGGDNYYNTITGASNINFSNSSSAIVFRQNDISSSSITHSGVSTGTFTLNTSVVNNSNIFHAVGAGNFSATGNNNFLSGANISHTTGTMSLVNVHNYSATISNGTSAAAIMTLNQVYAHQGSNITNQSAGTLSMTQSTVAPVSSVQRQAGSTGALTVNYTRILGSSVIANTATNTGATSVSYCSLEDSSNITNDSASVISINHSSAQSGSSIRGFNGSGGAINVTDTALHGNSSIYKLAASTAGTVTVSSGTIINSSSFIQTSGTGNIGVASGSFYGSSGVNITGGNRSYSFTRLIMSSVSRANLSGTGVITDNHSDFELHYRSTYTNSCSGSANSINYCECSGLSGSITLSGTTGGSSLNRIKLHDGSFTKSNNPNAGTYQLWSIRDAGVVNLTNHAAGENINYVDVSNGSSLNINRTGSGIIQYVDVSNNGTATLAGTSTTINKLSVEQGTVIVNAGSIGNVSKKMLSVLTINAGAQNNVHHWNSVNKTATVANTGRVDYLGVVSSVPIV